MFAPLFSFLNEKYIHIAARKQEHMMNMIKSSTFFIVLLFVLEFGEVSSQFVINTLPGFAGKLPFKLETGYVDIGKKEDVHMFYYFVESERDPSNDPLIIWLSGGPGCSTLRGFFYEIGPLNFNYAKSVREPILELNPYSWTKVANIIFLDQPVTTGFSYADNLQASRTSDSLSATQTYEFLKKWLKIHPEFVRNPLYICGISYTGVVVPAIVQKIYKGNEDTSEVPLNIKGYVLGNPVTDKIEENNARVGYAYRMGLISEELYKLASDSCQGDYDTSSGSLNALCQNNIQALHKNIDRLNYAHILEPLCDASNNPTSNLLKRSDGFFQDNPIRMDSTWCRDDNYEFLSMWGKMKNVQDALHIRKGTIDEWNRCNEAIRYHYGTNVSSTYWYDVSSSLDFHRDLLTKNCRALIFSGDHDMVVPYSSTEKWILSLNLTMQNNWDPWIVENQVGGYTSTFSRKDYSLTFATLKGAGHTGPEYKPKESLTMADRWFAGLPI